MKLFLNHFINDQKRESVEYLKYLVQENGWKNVVIVSLTDEELSEKYVSKMNGFELVKLVDLENQAVEGSMHCMATYGSLNQEELLTHLSLGVFDAYVLLVKSGADQEKEVVRAADLFNRFNCMQAFTTVCF